MTKQDIHDEQIQRTKDAAAQIEIDDLRNLAYEAGRNLSEIPKSAHGNFQQLESYKAGLQEPRTEGSADHDRAKVLERDADKALNEAKEIQEVVRRELSSARLFHEHAKPGEKYEGRVIGKTNSYVIQADHERPGAIVLHERAAVSGAEKIQMNEHAQISYPYGRAGIAKTGDAMQKQAQMQKQLNAQHQRERG